MPPSLHTRNKYRSRSPRARGSLLQELWDHMRTKSTAKAPGARDLGFTTASLAKAVPAAPRYIRIYVRALVAAGYIESTPFHSYTRRGARVYKLTGAYDDSIAPQLAGGANSGGGRLGSAWQPAPPTKPKKVSHARNHTA